MSLFEFLILAKLYPASFVGCGFFLVLLLIISILAFLWDKGILQIIIIAMAILSVISIFYSIKQANILKRKKQLLNNLADNFIKNVMTPEKEELNRNDYLEFYKLVKKEGIDVKNDYNTEVPYKIRNALYTAYLKQNTKKRTSDW